MTPRSGDLAELRRRQLPEGSWGASVDLPGTVEPTSLAILALTNPRDRADEEAARAGRAWLRDLQNPDGSWPHSREVAGSSWMSSLALLALAPDPSAERNRRAGLRWLLRQEGRAFPWHVRLRLFLTGEQPAVDLDSTLTGWPWMSGTFSWVEPTSYALLALRMLHPEPRPKRVGERLDEGAMMLIDRVCPGGGWNYGNSVVLGEELEPYPDTTALALLALQDVSARHEAVHLGLDALEGMIQGRASQLTLSLSILALQLHGREVNSLRGRLTREEPVREDVDTRSLAFRAMALDATAHPFSRQPSVLRQGAAGRAPGTLR